jgi:hypothetical protein
VNLASHLWLLAIFVSARHGPDRPAITSSADNSQVSFNFSAARADADLLCHAFAGEPFTGSSRPSALPYRSRHRSKPGRTATGSLVTQINARCRNRRPSPCWAWAWPVLGSRDDGSVLKAAVPLTERPMSRFCTVCRYIYLQTQLHQCIGFVLRIACRTGCPPCFCCNPSAGRKVSRVSKFLTWPCPLRLRPPAPAPPRRSAAHS